MNMAANGTASTTPTIRNAVRGSQVGSLRGRVSSTPYANRMHNPMVQPRITSTNKDAYVCRPTRKPNPPDTASVNRNRGQANTRANLMDCLYRKEVDRTNRIGVGITGFHEFAYSFFGYGFRDIIDEEKSKDFWMTIARFKRAVVDEARRYSEQLGVVVPHTDTTIKPAGTTSKLFGLSEGAHLPAMGEYLRWVQFRHDDPLVQQYRDAGYPVRELVNYPGTSIVGFPTVPVICTLGMGDKLVTAGEATPEEQYQYLRLMEKYWIRGVDANGNPLPESGNQVSYTLKYDPKVVSYEQFRKTLMDGQSSIRCCSVMPQTDASAYEYQPEEPVSRERFQEIVAQIQKGVKEEVAFEHIDCGSGGCPVDFDEEDLMRAEAEVEQEKESEEWLVFTATNCPACTNAKALLKSKGIEFEEISLQNAEGFRFMRSFTDAKTVPVIIRNKKLIGDFNDLRLYLSTLSS